MYNLYTTSNVKSTVSGKEKKHEYVPKLRVISISQNPPRTENDIGIF